MSIKERVTEGVIEKRDRVSIKERETEGLIEKKTIKTIVRKRERQTE